MHTSSDPDQQRSICSQIMQCVQQYDCCNILENTVQNSKIRYGEDIVFLDAFALLSKNAVLHLFPSQSVCLLCASFQRLLWAMQ